MIGDETLSLRAVEPADVDLLYNWENQMEIWTVGNTLAPFSKAVLEKYVKHATLDLYQTKQLRLMIDAMVDGHKTTIGMIDLYDFDPYHSRAGVGILINQAFRHQGFAGKALQVFIDYCFTHLRLHQIYCSVTANNDASIKLFESQGFTRSGVKRDWRKTATGYVDEIIYQMIQK